MNISKIVTDEMVEEYRERGVVFLEQVIAEPWLELIDLGFRRNMNCPGPMAKSFQHRGSGRFFTDNYNFFANPEFQRLLYDSPIVDILGALMGSEQVWLYYDQIFYKGDGETVRTGWHQDMPYYQMANSPQIAGAWISLDPLEKEYSLEFVPGSHKGPIYNPVNPDKPSEVGFDVGGEPVPNIQAERDKWDIVSFATRPGDMLVIHPGILHGGAPAKEGMERRTMTINVYGEDVVFLKRPKGYAPATPSVGEVLKDGDPLRHPCFPQLRPVPDSQRAA